MLKRPRVSLRPGKSVMDWVNFTTKKLFSTPSNKTVDAAELSKHNTEKDCWMLLGDKVYDVTKYVSFHPGGPEELLRAAGCDGTKLFAEIHGWVNYEALLKSCYVGKFVGDRHEMPPPKNSSLFADSANPADRTVQEVDAGTTSDSDIKQSNSN
uniref:Cytochrome b5 heme-binding domain-containing protein n=1 Tax=Syphacia muris TaxID=451379 RepID=A0A0N5B0J7_9BILA